MAQTLRVRALPRRSSDDAGFVLATAIVVLAIITVLIGAAVTVSLQDSTSTEYDSNVKASLATAEAGLQAVTYRLNELKPKPSFCLNNLGVPSETKLCESGAEQLSNNATFKYWMSSELVSGEKCAGEVPTLEKNYVYRCVTAEGKVNGVYPATRVQALLKSSIGESLFSIHGILGLEEVLVNGAVKATSVVASNKLIKGEGSAAFEQGFELCSGGTFVPAAGTERNKSGVTVGGVGGTKSNPPYERTRSASECPITAKIPTEHPTAASNEDYRISNHEDKDSEQEPKESWNKLEYVGGPTYSLTLSSSPNRLEIGNPKSTSPTRYYFCSLIDKGELIIAKGAKVEIFIGSTSEGCPSGSGKFAVNNAGKINNPNGAASLLIEVAEKGTVEIGNSGELAASIFDPGGEVVMSGAGKLTGAIVGNRVKLEAGSFNYSEETSTLVVGSSNAVGYSRVHWRQCSAGTTGNSC